MGPVGHFLPAILSVLCEGTPIPRTTQRHKERRRHVRYPLRTAAFFTWERSGGTLFRGEGTTRDISLRSVYVLSETCPPIDVIVEMKILLPRPSPAPGLSIVGKLRTQRIEASLGGKKRWAFRL